MSSLDAFWNKPVRVEKQLVTKTEAKYILAAATYQIRHSGAKKFEITVIIRELLPP
jgi:uncharacterized membrane-anchored protein